MFLPALASVVTFILVGQPGVRDANKHGDVIAPSMIRKIRLNVARLRNKNKF